MEMTDERRIKLLTAIIKEKIRKEGVRFETAKKELSELAENLRGKGFHSSEIKAIVEPIFHELVSESLNRSEEVLC